MALARNQVSAYKLIFKYMQTTQKCFNFLDNYFIK